jgi:NSS family neurotransmitter:Na+ symporter
MDNQRATWGSNFGFLMAAIGSAVGLGNIWGFPYKMGNSGGFAFLVVYLVLAAVVGFTVLLCELSLGRRARKGCIGAYHRLASRKFAWVGWLGGLSAFIIMSFYTVLGAYCLKYMVVNFGDILGLSFGANGTDGGKIFGGLLTSQLESWVYTLVFVAATGAIIMGGIDAGIERFNKYAMPLLFVMLLIIIARSVTLEGAEKGLAFMFQPNWEPLKNNFLGVLATASGQMFFSLSLGMAIMVTYGSYLPKNDNIERDAAVIVISDTVIAVLAGVAVLPAAFALGGENAALAGPKLLYITLQNVFNAMGSIGPWIGFLFYTLVVIAALSSLISLMETTVTFIIDSHEARQAIHNRKRITFWVCVAVMAEATIVALDGLGSNGLWVPGQSLFGVHTWNDCWLDFMDAWSEGFMMPLGAFLTCLFVGYELKIGTLADEIEQDGIKFRSKKFVEICLKYIAPVILLFVLYNQLKDFGLI